MKRLAIVAAALLLSACSSAPVLITGAETKKCTEGDGCVLVTKDQMVDALRTAFQRGKKSCWNNTDDLEQYMGGWK